MECRTLILVASRALNIHYLETCLLIVVYTHSMSRGDCVYFRKDVRADFSRLPGDRWVGRQVGNWGLHDMIS